jgi:hypothetical protein
VRGILIRALYTLENQGLLKIGRLCWLLSSSIRISGKWWCQESDTTRNDDPGVIHEAPAYARRGFTSKAKDLPVSHPFTSA